MQIAAMTWAQVEARLATDDRAVLPLGCTEQHAHLSLATDSILAERIAAEAAAPLGVPVFPVLPYGITPGFTAYPGTVSLRVETYGRLLRDILDSLRAQGFRRILLVNGHGGNAPAQAFAQEWMMDNPGSVVRLHNWWNAPRTLARVHEIDPVASHASWMENFPWTRLEGVTQPALRKPLVDFDRLRAQGPAAQRAYLGDGNFGGYYERSDDEMLSVWQTGVEETRAMIAGPWA
jgi:creatinine amidohydrolase